MKALRNSLWLAVVLLAGCQFLGVAQPETFNQRLLVGYESVASIRETASTLFVAGKIDVAVAENVQAQADLARSGLDIAASTPDPTQAENRLEATLVVLKGLNAYLEAKQ